MSLHGPRPALPRFGEKTLAGYAAWRDAMQWQRTVNRVLRPLGLTHTRLLVLHATDRACRQGSDPDGVSQIVIAREAGLDPMTTSTLVRALSDAGFLDLDVAFDGHSYQVLVTRKGLQLLEKCANALESALERGAMRESAQPAITPPRRARRRSSRAASG